MSEPKLTRCPGCGTVFRVTAAQLSLREGQVRCGHCRAVFDANDHFVSLEIQGADEFGADDELMRGRPTVTLRSADALLPAPHATPPAPDGVVERSDAPSPLEEPAPERNADETPVASPSLVESPAQERASGEASAAAGEGLAGEGATGEGATGVEPVAVAPSPADATATVAPPAAEAPPADGAAAATLHSALAPIDVRDVDRPPRFEWKKRKDTSEPPKRVYAAAIVILAIAILLQVVLEFRDSLAAHVPATRTLLAGACRALSCTIEPLKDTAALSIDASDLQADPAHRGLLVLSATIRNRATHPIAYPYLELTLTDSSERIVVRRAFAPQDYAGGTADLHAGIAVNGERLVKLFIDASATQQAGYQLYLFYP
jgi:predicted Zn finger-like uncharacterized protein